MKKGLEMPVGTLILLIMITSLFGCEAGYKKKDGKVYYITYSSLSKRTIPIDSADYQSFTGDDSFWKNTGYGKDKNYVFFEGHTISNADPATFKPLGDNYAVDKNSVFFKDEQLNANPLTFRLLGHYFATDNGKLFSDGNELDDISDPKSFHLLEKYKDWAKDDFSYYYKQLGSVIKLQDIDYETFIPLEKGYAKDKNHIYYVGSIWENWVADDGKNQRIVPDANPQSFKILTNKGTASGQDGDIYYIQYMKVTKADINKMPNEKTAWNKFGWLLDLFTWLR